MRRRPLNDGWSVRSKVSLFAELAGGAAGGWVPVTLPHDAMIGTRRSPDAGAANAYFPGGRWEYRRNLEGNEPGAGRAVVLEFEGVYRDAAVVVNGMVAARRPYGYTRFCVTIDHLLHVGENEIRVEAGAGEDSRWYSGAGIHRDVWLLEAGPVHLSPDGLSIRTPEIDDERAVVNIGAVVHNWTASTTAPTLRLEVVDADGRVVARDEAPVTCFPGDAASVRRRLEVADPRRWRLDDPYLYTCRATVIDGDEIVDADASTFGIRSLALDARRGLRINGEPVALRGACVHHDNGPLGSAAIGRAEERRVERLKAAGFNAIRSAHNPMSRSMLDACDRLGVVVMDEAFDMWSEAKSNDDYARRFPDWWEADVEAMVRSAENHPSVVFYSIGNEIPDGSTPAGLRIGRALADKVRSLDDSRYVTQAVTGILVGGPEIFADMREASAGAGEQEAGVNTIATTLADIMQQAVRSPIVDAKTTEAFAPLDVAGYNYMESRYELDVELHPDRVIVGTETHPPAIAAGWAKVTALPNVIGDFTWTGWDYLGEVGIGRPHHADPQADGGPGAFHGDFPWRTAWCGDIDITGHRRPQSYYREIVFGLRTDPHLVVLRPEHQRRPNANSSPWSWSDVVASWTWPGHEGDVLAVEVYAAADEVELLLDGHTVGRQPAGASAAFRSVFEVAYQPGTLEAIAWSGGEAVGRCTLRSASDIVRLDLRADRHRIAADHTDLVYLDLILTDEAGTVHVTADRRVEVAVDGPGRLQAIGSADPRSDEPFTGTGCTTFDGRALVILRPTGAGEITVSATAEGCEPQKLTIEAR